MERMLAFLSPAKNIRITETLSPAVTTPCFYAESQKLAEHMKSYSPWQLESLLKLNPELALKAFSDYQEFDGCGSVTTALLGYHGLAYQSMSPMEFTQEELSYSQDSLRILSALYGVLRPLDGIRPYRLEFQCGVRYGGGNLYRFWGDRIGRALFSESSTLVNLASAEYARAVLPWRKPGERIITCDFVIHRRGKQITLPTLAKMARGRMARYLVTNRLTQPEQLRRFEWEGFSFLPELSTKERYLYLRRD